MKRALFLATTLRAAGLKVVEHSGWKTRGRDFANLRGVVWHHDASPVGDSPGVPAYMLREMAAGRAGAQIWVDRYGVWHLLAAGQAGHAGVTKPGALSNSTALGIETDHTVGETITPAMLTSLRAGTAAILRHLQVTAGEGLAFHKTICHPHGRKVDPYGLDLRTEQRAVTNVSLVKYALGDRVLSIGMEGDDVAALQKILKITVDGDFGPATDAAVRWVQTQHKITVDGIVGPATLKALLPSPTPPATPVPAPVVVPEGPTVYVFTDPREPRPQYVSADLVTKRWVRTGAELHEIVRELGKNLVRVTFTPGVIDAIVTVGALPPASGE